MSRRTSPAALWHFLAVAGALATAALVATRPVWHDDAFLHMRTGELVAQTGRIPTVDPFTFTVLGQEWTSHEWGFGLMLHAVRAAAGFAGLIALMPVLIVALLTLIYLEQRRFLAPAWRALAAPSLLLAVLAGDRSCLILRAALITTLGMAALLCLLRRLRERGGRRYELGVLGVLLVWANMHAGVAFGLFVVGLYGLQALWDERTAGLRGWLGPGQVRQRAVLLAASAAVTLLNPSGFELWTFPFRVNKILYHSGVVYSMGQYAAPSTGMYPAFFLLVCAVLAACLPLRRLLAAVRRGEAPLVAQGLGTLFFLVMALRSNRFILDFALFGLIFVAMSWGQRVATKDGASSATAEATARPWLRELAAAAVVLVLALLADPALPERTIAKTTPVALADFMAREQLRGRMFNYENFGGYLGWRLRQPVYWDGRNDIFGALAREYVDAKDLGELIARHGLELLIFNAEQDHRFRGWLAAHREQWALVFFDDVASLYVERAPKFARTLQGEYRLLRPFGTPSDAELAKVARDPRLLPALEREIERAIGQSRDNSAAWYMRGRLYAERGDRQRAKDALARAAAIRDPR